jgi:hypothetical protein
MRPSRGPRRSPTSSRHRWWSYPAHRRLLKRAFPSRTTRSRAKLRAVVQEQQKTYEQEQREERRERWATRREALLLELGKEVGLTNEQRAEMLHLMLATRDQIGDTFQSAQTPEAINESREKARVLRQQTDAQIRELLKPAQYEAYRARFEEDDEAERRARGPRGERERTPP